MIKKRLEGNMSMDEIWNLYELVLLDDIARLRSRNRRVDARDVKTIFEPVLLQIAKAAGGYARQRTLVHNRLGDWLPADVTEQSLRTFVSRIVEAAAPPFDLAAMRARQRELERELSAV